jgi:hypothetical protein
MVDDYYLCIGYCFEVLSDRNEVEFVMFVGYCYIIVYSYYFVDMVYDYGLEHMNLPSTFLFIDFALENYQNSIC